MLCPHLNWRLKETIASGLYHKFRVLVICRIFKKHNNSKIIADLFRSFRDIHFSVIDSVWEAEGFVDFRNFAEIAEV